MKSIARRRFTAVGALVAAATVAPGATPPANAIGKLPGWATARSTHTGDMWCRAGGDKLRLVITATHYRNYYQGRLVDTWTDLSYIHPTGAGVRVNSNVVRVRENGSTVNVLHLRAGATYRIGNDTLDTLRAGLWRQVVMGRSLVRVSCTANSGVVASW